MDKRTAKRLADKDSTEYAVYWRSGGGLGLATGIRGYRNARAFLAGLKGPALILTRAEAARIRDGWRPALPETGE
jgi:hypothetical protein